MQNYKFKESTTQKGGNRDLSKVTSIILHTTGYGAGLQRIDKRHRDKEDHLERVGEDYACRMANVLKYKGHYLIDHTGKIWQFIPLNEIAWHTGSSKRKLLKNEEPFAWWQKRWPKLKKPTDLKPWKTYPNASTVGIDLLAHGNGEITSGYTDEQYESLAYLVDDLCERLSINIERENILGHEDVDPISRGSAKGGWDPGRFEYDRLLKIIRERRNKEVVTGPKVNFTSMIKKIFSWF